MKKLSFLLVNVFILCACLLMESCSSEKENSPIPDSGTSSSVTAVDMGVSVKWADKNVGATRPDVYGGYYAWGEIWKKSEYSWFTYDFSNDKDGYEFWKYNTKESYGYIDSLIVLEEQDDVASQLLGKKWRIPTTEEWQELIDNCSWEWGKVNNINGMVVTASNGNSIFLPAAGHKYDGMRYYSEGSYCDYWSSTLNSDYPREAVGMRNGYVRTDYRYNGFSIRAVCK